MEYQEIVTKYKKNSLATNNLKKRLDIAKPLEARPRYRVLSMSGRNWYYNSNITDLLTIQETPKRLDLFENRSRDLINEYFNELIERIKACKAWDLMGIKARDFSKERFESAGLTEKFAIINELNQKYYIFLESQKLADLRGEFAPANSELDNSLIMKICFLRLMFNNFKSDDVKKEFFCFDEQFLRALLKYRKSKDIRIEEHMRNQKKQIVRQYEKFCNFFTTEDFRDIIENIIITSRTLKIPRTEVMRIFAQMSEAEAEQDYLMQERLAFKELEQKCDRMNKLRAVYTEEKRIAEVEAKKKRLLEVARKKAEELEKARKEAERERIIGHNEGDTGELDSKIKHIQNKVTVKEAVIPFLLVWLDKDEITLTRKVGNQKLTSLFNKLKEIERKTGYRISLFLITNADQDITQRRIEEIKKRAKIEKMPRLFEGALGGYSSFCIDENGTIKEVSKMSPENREKIKQLLESSFYTSLPRSLVDENEQNYLRYKFSDKPDKNITKQYLGFLIGNILCDEKVKKQPLKFMPFVEKNSVGIDVVLESQLKGISRVYEYYSSKYDISSGMSYKVNIEDIGMFLDSKVDKITEGR